MKQIGIFHWKRLGTQTHTHTSNPWQFSLVAVVQFCVCVVYNLTPVLVPGKCDPFVRGRCCCLHYIFPLFHLFWRVSSFHFVRLSFFIDNFCYRLQWFFSCYLGSIRILFIQIDYFHLMAAWLFFFIATLFYAIHNVFVIENMLLFIITTFFLHGPSLNFPHFQSMFALAISSITKQQYFDQFM